MRRSEKPELKPCPFPHDGFVEVEPAIVKDASQGLTRKWHVQCWCGATGPHMPTCKKAIAAWNTRADHRAQLAKMTEAHERELQRLGSIEEKSHLQTIDERDRAEEALSQAYFLITGRSPEWSNLFGYDGYGGCGCDLCRRTDQALSEGI
jgi:hypothetical protein